MIPAINDYVAYLTGEVSLVDADAIAERQQMIADLKAKSEDTEIEFNDRLQAIIDYRVAQQHDPLADNERKARERLENAFIKAARSKKFASVTASDWEKLGIPKQIASQISATTQPSAGNGRVSAKMVVDWLRTLPAGTDFSFDTIEKHFGGGSRNTVKKGIELAQEQGIEIVTHSQGQFTKT